MAYFINENCKGCGICKSLCPVYAINGEKKTRHIINEKRCLECGVCAKVCTSSAVEDKNKIVFEKIPKKDWLIPLVDTNTCSACSMCCEICRFDALQISYPKFRGDTNLHAYLDKPDKCVGCSLCEKECPLGAITMIRRED